MYKVKLSDRAKKSLKSMDESLRIRVFDMIVSLGEKPRPAGYELIEDEDLGSLYRIREDDFRIIYQLKNKTIRVVAITTGY